MRKDARDPDELLPLTPAVLNILLALADEERHGYGIMREIERRTDGKTRMGPGTLYGSIKRMLAEDLIEESDERPAPDLDDERRRYYRLTHFGRRVAGAEIERLAALVSTACEKRLLPGIAPVRYPRACDAQAEYRPGGVPLRADLRAAARGVPQAL